MSTIAKVYKTATSFKKTQVKYKSGIHSKSAIAHCDAKKAKRELKICKKMNDASVLYHVGQIGNSKDSTLPSQNLFDSDCVYVRLVAMKVQPPIPIGIIGTWLVLCSQESTDNLLVFDVELCGEFYVLSKPSLISDLTVTPAELIKKYTPDRLQNAKIYYINNSHFAFVPTQFKTLSTNPLTMQRIDKALQVGLFILSFQPFTHLIIQSFIFIRYLY
jgi:hypothetical protein